MRKAVQMGAGVNIKSYVTSPLPQLTFLGSPTIIENNTILHTYFRYPISSLNGVKDR